MCFQFRVRFQVQFGAPAGGRLKTAYSLRLGQQWRGICPLKAEPERKKQKRIAMKQSRLSTQPWQPVAVEESSYCLTSERLSSITIIMPFIGTAHPFSLTNIYWALNHLGNMRPVAYPWSLKQCKKWTTTKSCVCWQAMLFTSPAQVTLVPGAEAATWLTWDSETAMFRISSPTIQGKTWGCNVEAWPQEPADSGQSNHRLCARNGSGGTGELEEETMLLVAHT